MRSRRASRNSTRDKCAAHRLGTSLPRTGEELATAVASAARRAERVRAVGSGLRLLTSHARMTACENSCAADVLDADPSTYWSVPMRHSVERILPIRRHAEVQ
jgi:hypothetical protein